ncbi:PIN domain-like family protein [Forsythia ovata]|uniref:PIN domain-like family protein n=1 Tax=Forsythia ovata TaxID=205694 RepID=A0ABD1VPD7_9LAMI
MKSFFSLLTPTTSVCSLLLFLHMNRIAKDPRFERLPFTHKGTYAGDCLVERFTQHKCYIVAICDRDLKRRIRKVPGVSIMYITQHKYSIERLPEATIGGAPRM